MCSEGEDRRSNLHYQKIYFIPSGFVFYAYGFLKSCNPIEILALILWVMKIDRCLISHGLSVF